MTLFLFQDNHGASLQGLMLIALGCVALTPVFVLGYFLYNVFLHPLRSYPGPKLWAGFRVPYVYYQMTGCLPLRVKDLHDRYGPVVRVAPDELSYITALAWKEIYGFRTGHSQNPKHLGNHAALHEDQERHMLVANDEVHARHRRLLAHAFSAQAIEEQMPLIMSYVDLLVQRLKENAAQPQDMIKWFVWTSFDIIADLMFGEPFRGLQDQYYHPWVQGFCDGLEGAIYISAFNRYGLGFCLPYIIPKKLLDRYAQTWMYTKKSVASRLERGTDRPDFMSCILRNDKDGRQMSRGEIDANAELLILAGSETTSSLLTGATYYLCKYPDVLEKVTAEVRGAFDSDRKIVLNSVNQLEYLLAVLNEALRMYPPAPASLPRIILNGDVINGRWVPPGTIAGVFQYAAYHSEFNFHKPELFAPERWLPNRPAEFSRDNRDACQPFSAGPRNCIGKNLAYLEMRLILAKILWNFDLSLDNEAENWINQKMHIIWVHPPLMVRLKPVQRGADAVKTG